MPSPSERAAVRLEIEQTRFNKSVQRYIQRFRLQTAEAVAALAFELEGLVKEKTPVDTGRLRASIHTVLYGQNDNFTYRITPRGRQRPATYFGGLLTEQRTPLEAIVGTNVEYALPIEAGHSRQAPSGMFRVSMVELRGRLAELMRQRRGR